MSDLVEQMREMAAILELQYGYGVLAELLKNGANEIENFRHESIVGWLVWAPDGDAHDYYVFANQSDAEDKQSEFDQDDPDGGEHAIEALVCHPSYRDPESRQV